MKIFTLEGLPLVGKTMMGLSLCEDFNRSGIKSLYRHGQITDNQAAKICIGKAFECLAKWDGLNKHAIFDFIKYRYEQIYRDFHEFQNRKEQFGSIECLFLDRYITGHDVMARFFGYAQHLACMDGFYKLLTKEFLLVCDFEERKRRALIRKKTNNLTEYSLESRSIHTLLQKNYCNYFGSRKNCRITSSGSYDFLKNNIIGEINAGNFLS